MKYRNRKLAKQRNAAENGHDPSNWNSLSFMAPTCSMNLISFTYVTFSVISAQFLTIYLWNRLLTTSLPLRSQRSIDHFLAYRHCVPGVLLFLPSAWLWLFDSRRPISKLFPSICTIESKMPMRTGSLWSLSKICIYSSLFASIFDSNQKRSLHEFAF